MRGSIWVFIAVLLCAVPMAIGNAVGAVWPVNLTFALWVVIAVVSVVALFRRKSRRTAADALGGAASTYNAFYLSQPHSNDDSEYLDQVVASGFIDRPDELATGHITVPVPRTDTAARDETPDPER